MQEPGGRFIAIEGIDGSGTTLQTRALADWLRGRGHEVVETREPSDGGIGRMVRERLRVDAAPLDPAALALLFAADRLDHVAREVDPARRRGAIVLTDRYLLSSLAYQSLDCDLEWVRTINRAAPPPDLYLFLRVPAEVAFDRVQRRAAAGAAVQDRFDELELQRTIAARYEAAGALPGLGEIVVVDGTMSPAEVTSALADACARRGL
jgi:dTMP kinase